MTSYEPNATHSVAELARSCAVDAAELRPVLAQLYERGWLSAVPSA